MSMAFPSLVLRFTLSVCLPLVAVHSATADHLIRVPAHQPTIQAAIDAADHGDTILIDPGRWTGPGNRDLDPAGKAIVIRSVNGPETCIIDCQGLGRGFHFHSCESSATVLQGLTISGGHADLGGGIRGFWSSPRIVNCVVTDCAALGQGGGISGNYFSPQIVDCRIEGNRGMDGGGICLEYCPDARLVRCTISGNNAQRNGGGVCCHNGSTPRLIDCTITGNEALFGGGVSCRDSAATIRGCEITRNMAFDGGGLCTCGPAGPLLLDTLLTGNKASYGGAIFAFCGSLQVSNCLLLENFATVTGGALHGRQLDGTVAGCTFSGNMALESRGGGLSCMASRLVVIDSILWGNHPDEITPLTGEQPLVTYSSVAGGYPGQGNLAGDPLFTCAPCGSHCLSQLQAGEQVQSPCVDAGSRPARLPTAQDSDQSSQSSGTITRSDWSADTGRLDLGYHHRLETTRARLDCLPSLGWLPFPGTFTVTLTNPGPSLRRAAARVDVITADGASYPNWRTGWVDVEPGKPAAWSWRVPLPAHPALTGMTTLSLAVEDVTPPPFNQSPCPPAGHRSSDLCTVTGLLLPPERSAAESLDSPMVRW